jgi:hypothetical protein
MRAAATQRQAEVREEHERERKAGVISLFEQC